MLLFAHTGIPLGAAWFWHKASAQVLYNRGREMAGYGMVGNPGHGSRGSPRADSPSSTWLDYRLLLLGSMLPDLIDKPLGIWLLRDALSNGRIFGHTAFFTVLLVAIGIYLYTRSRNPRLLCLSFGSMAHLFLDEMWNNHRTLLWPLYGWGFEKADVSHWLGRVLTSLGSEPSVYVPEIIGALFLGAFLFNLIRQGKLYSFLTTGHGG